MTGMFFQHRPSTFIVAAETCVLQHQSEAREQTAGNHNESVSTAELDSGSRILAGLTRAGRRGRRGTGNTVKDLVGRRRGRRRARGRRARRGRCVVRPGLEGAARMVLTAGRRAAAVAAALGDTLGTPFRAHEVRKREGVL